MARLSKKQRNNAYMNYVKRYKEKQKSMHRRGLEMNSPMMKKNDYFYYRNKVVDKGQKININQTLVAQQQYAYGQKIARQLKSTAQEFDLVWQDLRITEIRTGKIDLSGINDALKDAHPDWSGRERAHYISWEIFGSK